ncbi:MAG: hypothetical protein ABJO88_17780 [Parasphingorhabdus sp.]
MPAPELVQGFSPIKKDPGTGGMAHSGPRRSGCCSARGGAAGIRKYPLSTPAQRHHHA